jgi:hypothetical protein
MQKLFRILLKTLLIVGSMFLVLAILIWNGFFLQVPSFKKNREF